MVNNISISFYYFCVMEVQPPGCLLQIILPVSNDLIKLATRLHVAAAKFTSHN